MIDGTCEGCIYEVLTITDDNEPHTKCKRFPPTLLVQDGEIIQTFPDASDRCGEYKEEIDIPKVQLDPDLRPK